MGLAAEFDLFLFDMDGVLVLGKEDVRLLGGIQLFSALKARGKQLRVLTNGTTHTARQIAAQLQGLGLPLETHEVYTALDATAHYIHDTFGPVACLTVGEEGLERALAEHGLTVTTNEEAPVVVVGMDRTVSYARLSAAMRCLMQGAALVACHVNRFWIDTPGLCISAGPLVKALEYAGDVTAISIGKPEARMFESLLQRCQVPAQRALMIGDSLEVDIAGAHNAGVSSLLLLSGKTTRAMLDASPIKPHRVLGHIDEMVALL